MGIEQSNLTADDLWKKESAKRTLQILSAAGSAVLLSPVIMLALPIIGAYEFSKDSQILDVAMGGLLGVVVSPLAPFYYFLSSIRNTFGVKRNTLSVDYLRRRAEGMLCLDFAYSNIAIVGSSGTGKVYKRNEHLLYSY